MMRRNSPALAVLIGLLVPSQLRAAPGDLAELEHLAGQADSAGSIEDQVVSARWEESFGVTHPGVVQPRTPADPSMKLGYKARLFQDRTDREHRPWLGLIVTRRYSAEETLLEYTSLSDSAIWTGNYVASQAYRYAATGDERARRAMEESLRGLVTLHDVTGTPGLIARVIVPRPYVDAHGLPNEKHWHAGKGAFETYFWREHLSNDQYDGYLFGIAAAWPYIQDPALKAALKEVLRKIGRHVIDNDMRIRGKATFLDFRANYYYQDRWPALARGIPLPPWRAGASMHGLHLMKVCAELTGDPALNEFYQEQMILKHELDLKVQKQPFVTDIIRKHRGAIEKAVKIYYGEAIQVRPEAMRSSVGNNLSHMAFHDLARLETDPELKARYQDCFRRDHEIVAGEANSFWNFLYASQVPDPAAVREGVETLRRYPTTPILGTVQNSLDPSIPKFKGLKDSAYKKDQHWQWYAEKPLPFDRRVLHTPFAWQNNPYEMDGGFPGEQGSGTAYLVAYWLGRYHGFIGSDE